MFPNLEAEMARKKISTARLGSVIGCTEKSAKNKLDGITEFKLSEIQAILELFSECTVDYLFERSEKEV